MPESGDLTICAFGERVVANTSYSSTSEDQAEYLETIRFEADTVAGQDNEDAEHGG